MNHVYRLVDNIGLDVHHIKDTAGMENFAGSDVIEALWRIQENVAKAIEAYHADN